MGTIYKCLYRKWFGDLSFQRNNRYKVINSQQNNENPLYFVMTINVNCSMPNCKKIKINMI